MDHWSHKVVESTVSLAGPCDESTCPITVSGGSETGQFCYLGNRIDHDRLIYHSGSARLQVGDIVLEVQGQKVAGFTSQDLVDWIVDVGQNSTPVLMKLAKSGTLGRDLRPYLNAGFPKGSVDHDTQMTIRENLFQRTVPCTTRPPRDNEINGVDYTFVTMAEFRQLERNGDLLESGEFDGNFYGMPKPPLLKHQQEDYKPGAHPSSKGKRERNRSTIEATNKGHSDADAEDAQSRSIPYDSSPETGLPPVNHNTHDLPDNWEMAYTPEGHQYFIDHETETTHWLDPRLKQPKLSVQSSPGSELPYGWEKVDDPHYGTYYIDHLNRKTQYDPPTLPDMPRKSELAPAPNSPAPSGLSAKSMSYREMDSVSQQISKPFFTKDPSELCGEHLETTLVKSPRGFGFTIVGGEERDEEFLQVKNVVPNGPAAQNGVLATGDVLVRVNDNLVLGFTHSDVVSMFQKIKPGECVNLQVCRGYPLAFDPNDPNTEIVTTVAVSMPKLTPAEAKQREANRAKNGQDDDDDDDSSLDEFANSLLTDLRVHEESKVSNNQREATVMPPTGQLISMEIVRGDNGFGFTIADSVHGQKVKHILDPGRCKTLQEGDILVKIAGTDVRDMDHLDVVSVLKSCAPGKATEITIQRGGLKKTSQRPRKIELPDSQDARGDDSDGQRTPPPLPSKGVLSSDPAPNGSTEDLYPHSAAEFTDNARDSWGAPQITNGNRQIQSLPSQIDSRNENPVSQHPFLNQYAPNHQNPRESFYDIPNKFRSGGNLTASQRLDMYANRQEFQPPAVDRQSSMASMQASHPVQPAQQPPENRRSRTPGPEHLRPPPEKIVSDRFRSKTPNPSDHSKRNKQNDLNQPTEGPSMAALGPTEPMPDQGNLGQNWREQVVNIDVNLRRGDQGFGFRIVGGPEEGTQVAIGHIVPGGAADMDQRLKTGDEIMKVNGQSTVNESHHKVVGLMGQASSQGFVHLTVRRRIVVNEPQSRPVELRPYEVTVARSETEGFGFIIVSSISRVGAVIGRIIEGSPAERCGRLHVGDRILSVNGTDISRMLHEDVVNLIKDCGFTVKLLVSSPHGVQASQSGAMVSGAVALPALGNSETLLRNMHTHTASGTADRYLYNGAPPPTKPKPALSIAPGSILTVELMRGSRGFGFSIRGGREFNNMPLYVLRIAEDGAAFMDTRLMVGDEILEINHQSTRGMSHAEAIDLIQSGGSLVNLLVRRTGTLPPNISDQASPQGSGLSSPVTKHTSVAPVSAPDFQQNRMVTPRPYSQLSAGHPVASNNFDGPNDHTQPRDYQRAYPGQSQPRPVYPTSSTFSQTFNQPRPLSSYQQSQRNLPMTYNNGPAQRETPRGPGIQQHPTAPGAPPSGQGSYNAGAMNRQLNQQMYSYYDKTNAGPNVGRQPPVGQNRFDSNAMNHRMPYSYYDSSTYRPYGQQSGYPVRPTYDPQPRVDRFPSNTRPQSMMIGNSQPPGFSNAFNRQPTSNY